MSERYVRLGFCTPNNEIVPTFIEAGTDVGLATSNVGIAYAAYTELGVFEKLNIPKEKITLFMKAEEPVEYGLPVLQTKSLVNKRFSFPSVAPIAISVNLLIVEMYLLWKSDYQFDEREQFEKDFPVFIDNLTQRCKVLIELIAEMGIVDNGGKFEVAGMDSLLNKDQSSLSRMIDSRVPVDDDLVDRINAVQRKTNIDGNMAAAMLNTFTHIFKSDEEYNTSL